MKIPFASALQTLQRLAHISSSRAAAADIYPHQRELGIAADWSPAGFGDYIARHGPTYAAITIRAAALTSVPLIIRDREDVAIPPQHPAQRLMDAPNPFMTGIELRRILEMQLCLWGKAFWSNEIVEGQRQIWPVPLPHRMTALPGTGTTYIKGYRYESLTGRPVFYLPEEITFFAFPNPLQDRAGLSPIAPLRQTADMNIEALRFNKASLVNGGIPDFMLFTDDSPTKEQIDDFYQRWEERFQGPDKAHRPAIAAGLKSMMSMAFNQRDLEWSQGLIWGVEETSRIFGVPQPMLGSLREATLANVASLERFLWRNTMIPETIMLAAKMTNDLLPKLGYPDLTAHFDLSILEVLREEEEPRRKREELYLEAGVLSINEVRADRGLQPIAGGDDRDLPSRRMNRPAFEGKGQTPPTSRATELADAPSPTPRNGVHP